MQIVIDISEEEYNRIKENDCGLYNGRFFQMIRNGISLPEGHGKIVDANRVLENGDNWEVETALMQTEAIIEADKEKKDADSN